MTLNFMRQVPQIHRNLDALRQETVQSSSQQESNSLKKKKTRADRRMGFAWVIWVWLKKGTQALMSSNSRGLGVHGYGETPSKGRVELSQRLCDCNCFFSLQPNCTLSWTSNRKPAENAGWCQ